MKIRTDRLRWEEAKAQNSLEITQHVTSRAQNWPQAPLLLSPRRLLQAARGKWHLACTRRRSRCTAASIEQGTYTDLSAPSCKARPACLPQQPHWQLTQSLSVHRPGQGAGRTSQDMQWDTATCQQKSWCCQLCRAGTAQHTGLKMGGPRTKAEADLGGQW